MIFPSRPAYNPQTIRRILAVKVDHIGDFITAFPAFRRLKKAFPDAELVALVAPASMQLAALEPSIDQVIPFQFFNERSQLGEMELGEETLQALAKKLASFKFDIAVDLRMHPETRKLIQFAGAVVTAGFDSNNEFPWLDVAVTFERDMQLLRKRQHASDNLLNLIDAIVDAGSAEAVICHPPGWARLQAPIVARLAELGLFSRPLVCIHPAVGNEMRQWPARYFAELINLLLTEDDVDIVLIGGPDETPIARTILKSVKQYDRVHDLIGKINLDQLPYLIGMCALFVGNNSGPKHIAAGLGVPTVGIHSGVVDAREWGPLGASAVALQRNMHCSPCYKATRGQCDRGLACLEELTIPHVIRICRRLLRLNRNPPLRHEGRVDQP
jgi:ADP-heptose:LPS heptosyltransferase